MLTKKQKPILNFITYFSNKHDYAPSLEEIKKHFHLRSISTVHQHLGALENKGYLQKIKNQPRSITTQTTDRMIQIPLRGIIAAGQLHEAIENRETIAVPQNKLPFPNGNYYALRVSGDSMIEENINDGDIVLVKNQKTARNGEKVVALVDNSEATLKKFYKEKNHIRLQPANKTLKPIIINKNREVAIQGVVFDVIRNQIEEFEKISAPMAVAKEQILPLNQIICGDAVAIMSRMPDCSIDLTVTSPPYDELRNYTGYIFDFENIARSLFRVTKKGGIVVWVVGDKTKNGNRSLTSFRHGIFFQKIGFNVHDIMIYKKKNTPFMRSNAYTNCFEFMFVLSKGKPKTFNPLKIKTARQGYEMLTFNKGPDGINKKILGELKPEKTMTNIWEYAVGLHGTTSDKIAFQHPAVFPERLVEDHILSWTDKGDIIFDPMCGSGTTCKMAKKNDRHYIGCDISREYTELSKKRLERAKTSSAIC